ncbi:MAG: LytTR family DNA-binding domain-containing protein [Porticoccaceae bacterium]|jgi:two-component system, LytTR family, response regulator|nr:LytTR family DNA-binding domain-containing protein [Porticoccaceae bacterium]
MQKLRTIIVDDEGLARKLLRVLLEQVPEIELIAQCNNGREAVTAILDLEPDLVFLDIQMPGKNGFDVIKALQADLMPMIIFCTAYQRYALDAFDLHAVDYLLKPVDETRLLRAVQRACDRFQVDGDLGHQKLSLIGAIDEIAKKFNASLGSIDELSGADGQWVSDTKIAIKDQDSTVLIDAKDIDWVDAAGDYMCVHVKGVTHVMRSTLKSLMSRLDPDKFKRIHRSTVVNLDRIDEVIAQKKGEYTLHLDCDERLKVSRNYRDAIKNFLAQQ